MRQVEQTKKERTKVEEEFKGATVDMQSKFLQALAAESFLDNERIINTNIDEVYGPLRTQVAEIVENQQALIEQIQVGYWLIGQFIHTYIDFYLLIN